MYLLYVVIDQVTSCCHTHFRPEIQVIVSACDITFCCVHRSLGTLEVPLSFDMAENLMQAVTDSSFGVLGSCFEIVHDLTLQYPLKLIVLNTVCSS